MNSIKLSGMKVWQGYERALRRRPVPTQVSLCSKLQALAARDAGEATTYAH